MIKIKRSYDAYQTLGELTYIDINVDEQCRDIIVFRCKTIELPWLDNERNISCIPEGEYQAHKHISPKFGKSIWIREVPNRSEILVHVANFKSDLLGCIGVGEDFIDIDGDGNLDVTNSRKTIEQLYDLLPNEIFTFYISS